MSTINSMTMPLSTPFDDASLDADQALAIDLARSGSSLFLTGSAGTGKTACLRKVVKVLVEMYGDAGVFVCASTGLAGCNLGIPGVWTVHAFSGIGNGNGSKEELAMMVRSDGKAQRRWRAAKAIVIDEVSQLSGHILDKIEFVSRKARPRNNRVFSGIQVILCGDFGQLCPVDNCFAFESKTWNSLFNAPGQDNGKIVCLKTCYRIHKSEKLFSKYLNEVRIGDISPEGLQWFKRHCNGLKHRVENGEAQDYDVVHLVSTNKQMKSINDSHVASSTRNGKTVIEFEACDTIDSAVASKLTKLPNTLHLWIGCRVMLLVTLDATDQLVNGVCGIVDRFHTVNDKVFPIVRFETGNRIFERLVTETTLELGASGENLGFRTQIPLQLAYAITIHKAQGLELPQAIVELENIFANGQAYTALSRVTSSQGLFISYVSPNAIRTSPKVKKFLRQHDSPDIQFPGESRPKKKGIHGKENDISIMKNVTTSLKPDENGSKTVVHVESQKTASFESFQTEGENDSQNKQKKLKLSVDNTDQNHLPISKVPESPLCIPETP